jgi:oligopeptide transport system substrate-binding protein
VGNPLLRWWPILAFLGGIGGLWFWLLKTSLPPADYTVVNNTEVKTLDPALSEGVPEGRILWSIFEGLYAHDPKTLEPIPGVAESCDILDDGKRYVFHLRKNARWSDGSPITAEDFVYSMRRVLHPLTASNYLHELWYIVNSDRYSKRELKIDDPVEIELNAQQQLPEDKSFLQNTALDSKNKILKGRLKELHPVVVPGKSKPDGSPEYDQEYIVQVDGKNLSFHPRKENSRRYTALTLDFDQVPIRALDDHTLEIILKHPVPYFLELMAFYPYSPVKRACVEKYGPDWTRPENIVSNGPFKLQHHRFRERIRLVKNDEYWDASNVQLNIVDFLSIEGTVTSLNLYLTGKADWIERVPPAVMDELRRRKRPDFQPAPYITTSFYRLNVTNRYLQNKKLRQALNMALDKQAICDQIVKGGQLPARNLVSPVVDNHDPALGPAYDPAKAKLLFDEACDELRAAGETIDETHPLTLKLQYNSHEIHSAVAQFAQEQWQRYLGMRVELNALEWGSYLENMTKLKYEISRAGWVGDYKDPYAFIGLFEGDSAQNNTGWKNKEYDELLEKIRNEPDVAKRRDMLHDAEKLLMDEMPIIPLYFDMSTGMSRTYVKGLYPNYHDIHPLKSISIDLEEKARVLAEERGQ